MESRKLPHCCQKCLCVVCFTSMVSHKSTCVCRLQQEGILRSFVTVIYYIVNQLYSVARCHLGIPGRCMYIHTHAHTHTLQSACSRLRAQRGRTHLIRLPNSLCKVCWQECVRVCPGLTNLGRLCKCPAGIIHHTLLYPPQTRTTHINAHYRLPTSIHHPESSVQLATCALCFSLPLLVLFYFSNFTPEAESHLYALYHTNTCSTHTHMQMIGYMYNI